MLIKVIVNSAFLKVGLTALLPRVVDVVGDRGITVVAAGSISDARGYVAALALGAEGICVGTRFEISSFFFLFFFVLLFCYSHFCIKFSASREANSMIYCIIILASHFIPLNLSLIFS